MVLLWEFRGNPYENIIKDGSHAARLIEREMTQDIEAEGFSW